MLDKFKDIGSSVKKYFFRSALKKRIDLYKYFVSGLKSDLSINIKKVIESRIRKHERVHKKKFILVRFMTSPGGSEMPFLKEALRKVDEGYDNSEIFSDGWVTPNEEMLITSNSSGQMSDSLELAINLLEETSRIKKSIIGKLIYPAILFIILFLIMFGFSFYFIPILTDFSDPSEWQGSQALLYSLSTFIQNNAITIPMTLFVFVSVVLGTMGVWNGRVREYFDGFPPWSIYREFNAALFLISLSTMLKNGTTFINSLSNMFKTSSPYVRYQIGKMIEIAKKSEKDNSTALNTHLLGEVGDDIEDLARYGSFDKVLHEEGEKSINYIIEKIGKQADIFKYLALIFVMSYVIWAFGTFMSIVQSIGESM